MIRSKPSDDQVAESTLRSGFRILRHYTTKWSSYVSWMSTGPVHTLLLPTPSWSSPIHSPNHGTSSSYRSLTITCPLFHSRKWSTSSGTFVGLTTPRQRHSLDAMVLSQLTPTTLTTRQRSISVSVVKSTDTPSAD